MTGQGSMFDLGDASGDSLTYVTDDGAHVTAPSLFQQGDGLTTTEIEAERRAVEQLNAHRRHVAENEQHQREEQHP